MGELDWLLDNLVSSVLGVRIAVILSPDGLLLGKSPGVSQSEGDHLAALAAGAASLARGVGMWSGYGDVSQTIIEMDAALLFITPPDGGPAWPCWPRRAPTRARSPTRWPSWSSGSDST